MIMAVILLLSADACPAPCAACSVPPAAADVCSVLDEPQPVRRPKAMAAANNDTSIFFMIDFPLSEIVL